MRRFELEDSSKKKIAALFVFLSIIALIPLFLLFEESFSVHMALHLVLMFALAPALVGTQFFLWVFPPTIRAKLHQRLGALLTGYAVFSTPVIAFSLSTAFLWFSHVPAIFDATLTNDAFHAFIHFGLLATAVLYWQPLFYANKELPYLSTNESKVFYILASATQSALLGSLIAFSSTILFKGYLAMNNPSAVLMDQQLGGAIMLIAGAFPYTVAIFLSLQKE